MRIDIRKILLFSALIGLAAPVMRADDDYEDDIYYNPQKEKTEKQKNNKQQSNYIANFEDVDVDAYNRRGQYYLSPIDTIGSSVENGEDFVYTQQIQKFYNPTIVVDNADVLEDVLANSYGNVDIVYDLGYPSFGYNYYGWPYYNSWNWGWGPSFSFGWGGWNIGWYDPWYSWNWGWGPSWGSGWGPSWAWGWGPSWSWGPGWGWGGGFPDYRPYRPNGNHRVGPGAGWANNTRPGGNYNGSHRPAGGVGYYGKPGVAGSNTSWSGQNVGNHRQQGVGSNPTKGNATSSGYQINANGHRVTGNTVGNRVETATQNIGGNRRTGSSSNKTSVTIKNQGNQSSGNHRSYNSNSNNSRNSNSYNSNSNSYNSNRSSGSFNSGGSHRSSGGGFSGGGGGGRGRHR